MIDLVPKILVASPDYRHPFYAKSVILIVDEDPDEDAVLGIALNKEKLSSFSKLFKKHGKKPLEKGMRDIELYSGGPNKTDYVTMVHSSDYDSERTITLNEFVAVTITDPSDIEYAILNPAPKQAFIVGGTCLFTHKGLANGKWHLLPFDADIVFAQDRDHLWEDCQRLLNAQRPSAKCPLAGLFKPHTLTNRPC